MTRAGDWKVQLLQYLGQAARKPYQPGVHDCALFAAGAVLAMTGVDLAAQWRGTYATLAEGLSILQGAGFADHIALAAAHFDEIPASLAAPGDLAVLQGPQGAALGVVQGEGVYVLVASGMGILPIGFATRAFRVA